MIILGIFSTVLHRNRYALLTSAHNICINGEIRNNIIIISKYPLNKSFYV